MEKRVYFDNSATSPLDPRVVDAMAPFTQGLFGNPSSLHWAGREARAAIDQARQQVAHLIGAKPDEIIFTGSGTEANNLALRGVIEGLGAIDASIVTSAIEHPSVLEPCKYLATQGVRVGVLPVDDSGIVDTSVLGDRIPSNTKIVSVMTANNVVGTVQPIRKIGQFARERGALFHTDAVQAAGKLPIDVGRDPIDLLSLSAHKLNGPKGVGALYLRGGVPAVPLALGGGQERGLRSGTENVAGIVGLGKAAELCREEMTAEAMRLVMLRDRLIEGIRATAPNAYVVGHRYQRLPGHICVGFDGLEGEAIKLLLTLDEVGIAISSGSACSAHHSQEPSYILQAMGYDAFRARGSLRITLGRFNDDSDVDLFLDVLPRALETLRPIVSYSTGVPSL